MSSYYVLEDGPFNRMPVELDSLVVGGKDDATSLKENHIKLLGVLENRPVVFSIDEKSVIKLWDVRDFMSYQTFYVLKNV